jgi:hypothetical protein
MRVRAIVIGLLAVLIAGSGALGQAPSPRAPVASPAWSVPRLADGRPDLQGVWENNSATPLERPRELANTPRLTKSELDALRRSTLSTSRCSTRTGPPGARS